MRDAYFKDESGVINFSSEEQKNIKNKIDELEFIYQSLDPEIFKGLKEKGLDKLFKQFENYLVKNNMTIKNPEKGKQLFISFLESQIKKEAELLKTPVAKAKKEFVMFEYKKFIKKWSDHLLNIFNANIILTEIKHCIIEKFKQIKSLGTFLKTSTGFKVTGPEGFCVIDNDGTILKLVSRTEFSASNFAMSKNRNK
jgi:hypothetical protein